MPFVVRSTDELNFGTFEFENYTEARKFIDSYGKGFELELPSGKREVF